jgi:hypothetical protein
MASVSKLQCTISSTLKADPIPFLFALWIHGNWSDHSKVRLEADATDVLIKFSISSAGKYFQFKWSLRSSFAVLWF